MPHNDWRDMPLGEFVTLQRGHDLPEHTRRPGSIPVIGSFGVTGWHNTAKTAGPGVTVGRSGASFGVVTYAPADYWPLNTVLYVIDFHGNDSRFAYYLLKSLDFSRFNSGSAQPSLNRNFIHPVPIRIPPLQEQLAIATLLGTLDDKIKLNRRMNRTLEATARAIFKSWFEDSGSYGGEARRTGWSRASLGELGSFKRDTVDPGAFPDEAFDHYSIPAFDDGRMPVAQRGVSIRSTKLAVSGPVVLLSKLNPRIPRVWLPLPESPRRAVCSTEFVVMEPNASSSREFLYCLFMTEEFRTKLAAFATGTSGSHQRVKAEELSSMAVPMSPPPLVSRFTRLVGPMLDLLGQNLIQNRALAALRDALLPKLISGEIRVQQEAEGGEHLVVV